MFSKNRLLFLVCFLGAVLVLSFVGLFLFYIILPTYLESELIPGIGKDLGFEKVSCDVRSVGFKGSDIGSLRVGDDEKPALIVDSIQMDYTLTGLWRGFVERVLLSGMVLYCDVDNGRLVVRGLNAETLFPVHPSKETPIQATSNAFPVVPFDVLEIRNAFVVCSWEGRDLRLPVDLRISVREKQQDGFRCDLLMHVLGQQISSAAHVRFKAKSVEIAFDANGFRLEPFARLAAMVPGLSLWGEGDLGGKACLGLDPWRVTSTSLSCELRNGGMAYQGLSFQTGLKGPSGRLPCRIRIESNGDKGTLYVSGVSVQTAVPLAVSEFSSTIEKNSTGLRATGHYWLHLDPFERKESFPMAVHQPIRWKGQYSGVVQKDRSWDFSVKNMDPGGSAPQDFAVAVGGAQVTSQLFDLNVQVKGAGGQGSAEFEMNIPALTVRAGEQTRIRMPLAGLKGHMAFQPGERSGDFNLKMPQTEVRIHSVKVFVPHMALSGRFATDHHERLSLDGSLRFDNALIADPELDIEARGVKGDLRFAWPKEEEGGKSQLLVRSFRWKDLPLGTVKGSVRQKGLGVVFDGEHKNILLPGLTMTFSGVSQMASVQGHETKVAFEILPYKTVSPIDLGRFQPSLEGVSLAGSMAAKGTWRFSPLGAEGAMHGTLTDAKLEMGDDRHSINGLGIELSHFDPLVMRSAPLQQLHFENAKFGGLTATNGVIGFQIESANAVSIENGSFKWCGGTVHIGATYLSPDNESYDMVLYCDRLNLAMILEQFGVATAQGEGTVNGRIPVRLGKGTLRFGDGFLFSTPGDGGTINLSGTEKLTEGIPPNTPQFAQLELAREALKDFSYKWAKVALATEGDNLVLRMQLDGKPAKPLPFVFKKDLGTFVKMKKGEQSSVFQGIRLDVNFRLPLEKLLHYGNIFQNILEANE